ncbi:MAG: NADPH-dependent reductase [Nocardioidaceae bacterium]|nr:NADPH-dependent reductase [Nocardioidaceae bacterium]
MLRPERLVLRDGPGARVLLVSSSPTDVSRSDVLLRHVSSLLVGRGHVVDHLVLRDRPVVADSLRQLVLADGVVVTAPVQTTDPGLLETWLDLVPDNGFAGKLALPLAVDKARSDDLRPVLTALGARLGPPDLGRAVELFLHNLADRRKDAA